jgi:hypothetical protein
MISYGTLYEIFMRFGRSLDLVAGEIQIYDAPFSTFS